MKKIFIAFIALLFCHQAICNVKGQQDVPAPVFDARPEYVRFYYTAWQQARAHIKYQPGLVQPYYMDEGFRDEAIWLWDSEFMVMFCKYAPKTFPGIQTLDNFYYTLLEDNMSPLSVEHPDNPPFMAWVENDYYKFTGDEGHIKDLISNKRFLQRHFELFDSMTPETKFPFPISDDGIRIRKKELGYNWHRWASGMDNTPRMRGMPMYWVDAISQQALSALYITRLAKLVGDSATEKEYGAKYNEIKNKINKYYWDERDGCYYDIREGDLSKTHILTPASFWPMLAEIPSRKQAKAMVDFALREDKLGGVVPWKSVAVDDEQYDPTGDYWRGSLWLPTAYMSIKALEKYGFFKEANSTAEAVLEHMYQTYVKYDPHTIWECYSPTAAAPASKKSGRVKSVKPDFCGWSALGPISLFIENVLGFYDVDARTSTVKWNLHQICRHGIEKLAFGNITTDIIYENGKVKVNSDGAYTLVINGKKYKIAPGMTELTIGFPAVNEILVMSYNIRFGKAKDGANHWDKRKAATLAMLRDCSPDVFGVQECLPFQAKYILEQCPEYDGYGIGREDGVKGERTEIFWKKDKFNLLDKGTFWLSDTPDVPSVGWDGRHSRTATWVLLECKGGRRFYFVNTHLDHIGKIAPVKGLELIRAKIKEMNKAGLPVVLTGDFNLKDGNATIIGFNKVMHNTRLTAKKKKDDKGSFHAFGKCQSRNVIDYIYYDGWSKCKSFETIDRQYEDVQYISDHYPIAAILKF